MIPTIGSIIKTYGQEATIIEVTKRNEVYRCYLNHAIVVPGQEYTRNYINSNEIQQYIKYYEAETTN